MKLRVILLSVALATANLARAGYSPITIQSSSYNADVIVEQSARPVLTISTTASIDEGTNNYNATWFEQGFDTNHPANGLPTAGSNFVSLDNANFSFQMAPSYTAPNGILIDAQVTNGTFTLVTPKAYSTLSFLGMGGNGGDTISVTVHHQDSTTETETFSTSDWFGGTVGIAWIANGRISQVYNLNPETDGTSGDGLGNPRIYHKEITLSNTGSPVTSVVLNYVSGSGGSHSDVMALSGATTSGGVVSPIAVTGYDYDFIVEVGAPRNGRILSQTMANGTNEWATTQSIDNTNNTGNSWYEQGYNLNNDASGTFNSPTHNLTGTGLAHPGSFITNTAMDHVYQMPPDYTVNDAIYLSTTVTNDTITFTTPASYTGLSFLGSAGNGPVLVNATVNHQDGTSETNVLTINDWFNGSAPAAVIANGRVVVDTAQFQNVNGNDPRLLQNDIVLANTTSPVTSISLVNTNTAGGRFAIFAVSGSAGTLPPVISLQPAPAAAYEGTSASLTGAATANAPITYQWRKGTNGVYVNLTDGGNVSGSLTTNLTINPVGFTDQADYQLVATDSANFVDSTAATLSVFSTNTDVTEPSDPISLFGGVAFGDSPVAQAIDNNLGTKFGMNLNGGAPFPSGLVVSPGAGLTLVNALRIYTANDTTQRDPADYELEGSVDGGHSYTLIASNSLALPDGRNTAAIAPDPLNSFVQEVRFANTNGYTTYRLTFHNYKGGAGYSQLQIGEIELLGSTIPGFFFFVQPTLARAFDLSSASFSVAANSPTTTNTVSWFKGTNGVYVPLSDAGHITGSQTPNLSINPATFADVADYVAVANDGAMFITSAVAPLEIFSTNVDVSQPGDTIVGFGDTTGTRCGASASPANVIDNTFTEWINGGSGSSAGAGFPPFGGPVGVILTPAVGSTVLVGLRFYPGQDAAQSDPSGYLLEGSNNGGANYTTIASGSLSLPADRKFDRPRGGSNPSSAQEVLFSNTHSYSSLSSDLPLRGESKSRRRFGNWRGGVPGCSGSWANPTGIFSALRHLTSGNLNLAGSGRHGQRNLLHGSYQCQLEHLQ